MVVPGAGRVRCSLTSSVPVLSSLSPLESPLASADWFDDDGAAGVQCAGRMGDPVLAPLVLSQDEQHTLARVSAPVNRPDCVERGWLRTCSITRIHPDNRH